MLDNDDDGDDGDDDGDEDGDYGDDDVSGDCCSSNCLGNTKLHQFNWSAAFVKLQCNLLQPNAICCTVQSSSLHLRCIFSHFSGFLWIR